MKRRTLKKRVGTLTKKLQKAIRLAVQRGRQSDFHLAPEVKGSAGELGRAHLALYKFEHRSPKNPHGGKGS